MATIFVTLRDSLSRHERYDRLPLRVAREVCSVFNALEPHETGWPRCRTDDRLGIRHWKQFILVAMDEQQGTVQVLHGLDIVEKVGKQKAKWPGKRRVANRDVARGRERSNEYHTVHLLREFTHRIQQYATPEGRSEYVFANAWPHAVSKSAKGGDGILAQILSRCLTRTLTKTAIVEDHGRDVIRVQRFQHPHVIADARAVSVKDQHGRCDGRRAGRPDVQGVDL